MDEMTTPIIIIASSNNSESKEDYVLTLFLASMSFLSLYYVITILQERIRHVCFMESCNMGRNTLKSISEEIREWYSVSIQPKKSNENVTFGSYVDKVASWLVNKPYLLVGMACAVHSFYENSNKKEEEKIKK